MTTTESLFDLNDKVAVVTGAGDGIGLGACEILAAAGASVIVSGQVLMVNGGGIQTLD